jgi:hypothetical protein
VFALRTARLWLLLQFRDARSRPLATALALTALAATAVALALALGCDLSPLEPLLGAVRRYTTPTTCPHTAALSGSRAVLRKFSQASPRSVAATGGTCQPRRRPKAHRLTRKISENPRAILFFIRAWTSTSRSS